MPTRRAAPPPADPPEGVTVPEGRPVIGAPNWGVPLAVPRSDIGNPLDDFEEDADETPADRVASMLEEARGADRATVKLFRVLGPTKYAWCEDFSIEDFEAGGFAMIRDKWGPGEYEIRLYAIRPQDGRFGVRGKPRVTIEAAATPAAAANPAPGVDPAMREMLAQMAQTQARMLEALTQRPDPMAQMTQTIAMMGAMREAMGLNGPAAPAPQSSISETIKALRELREASAELMPQKDEADDTTNPLAMLPKVLDTVSAIANAQRGNPAPAVMPAPMQFPPVALPPSVAGAEVPADAGGVSLPVTQPATHAPADPGIPTDDEMNALQLVLMRGYLAKLCGMSAAGNVEDAADFALEKLPDEAIEILEMPEWFDLLAQFYPGAAPHREWLEKVRARVLAVLKEEGEGAAP